jgi:hypothetical protein
MDAAVPSQWGSPVTNQEDSFGKPQLRYSKQSKFQKSVQDRAFHSKPKTYRDKVSRNVKHSKKLKVENIQSIRTYLDAMKVEKNKQSNLTTSRNVDGPNPSFYQHHTTSPRKSSDAPK